MPFLIEILYSTDTGVNLTAIAQRALIRSFLPHVFVVVVMIQMKVSLFQQSSCGTHVQRRPRRPGGSVPSSAAVRLKPGFDHGLLSSGALSHPPRCLQITRAGVWHSKLFLKKAGAQKRRRRKDLSLLLFLATDDFTESQRHRLAFITARLLPHIYIYIGIRHALLTVIVM